MVLVFGLDVPLFEFLLVFMVLLTAGIIFILLELKRLNEYLIIERSDLKRLERDLGILETEEQKLGVEEARLGIVPPVSKKKSSRKKAAKKTVKKSKKKTTKKTTKKRR